MRSGCDGVFITMNDQPCSDLFAKPVAKLDHLLEFVAGVYVKKRKRKRAGVEGLPGQMYKYTGVLADRLQQHRVSELRNRFPQNVNGFAFKLAKMRPILVHSYLQLE